MVGQRVFGIACGYLDANDGDRLAENPIQKLLPDRHPVHSQPLASQPRVTPFENGVGARALYRLSRELAAGVIDRQQRRQRGRARRITIDLDVTVDPTHSPQQLTFFHGHYDTLCYLPLLAFLTYDDEAEQYLCVALLWPGNAATAAGTVELLQRLCVLVREALPDAQLRVRLDGGFAAPALLDQLDATRAVVDGRPPDPDQGGGRPPGRPRPARHSPLRYHQEHEHDRDHIRSHEMGALPWGRYPPAEVAIYVATITTAIRVITTIMILLRRHHLTS